MTPVIGSAMAEPRTKTGAARRARDIARSDTGARGTATTARAAHGTARSVRSICRRFGGRIEPQEARAVRTAESVGRSHAPPTSPTRMVERGARA